MNIIVCFSWLGNNSLSEKQVASSTTTPYPALRLPRSQTWSSLTSCPRWLLPVLLVLLLLHISECILYMGRGGKEDIISIY